MLFDAFLCRIIFGNPNQAAISYDSNFLNLIVAKS